MDEGLMLQGCSWGSSDCEDCIAEMCSCWKIVLWRLLCISA